MEGDGGREGGRERERGGGGVLEWLSDDSPVVEDNGTSSVLMLGLLQNSNEVHDSCTVGGNCLLSPLHVLVVPQNSTLIDL